MLQENKKRIIKENLAGCIGLKKPIPPNKCETCARHSDYTCADIKEVKRIEKKK